MCVYTSLKKKRGERGEKKEKRGKGHQICKHQREESKNANEEKNIMSLNRRKKIALKEQNVSLMLKKTKEQEEEKNSSCRILSFFSTFLFFTTFTLLFCICQLKMSFIIKITYALRIEQVMLFYLHCTTCTLHVQSNPNQT